MSDPTPAAAAPAPEAPVNVTRLLAEVARASSVLWVEVEARPYPLWYVWHDDGDPRGTGPAAYVVVGEGEQQLPELPEEVTLILRSKDNGGRLLRLTAATRTLAPDTPEWDAAVAVLGPARLNAPPGLEERWRHGCRIVRLTPHGVPLEGPGEYSRDTHATVPASTAATTATWRPWHLGGRTRRR
ncbi:MAG: hypothetical protein IPL94_10645 [Tetrasphaera sp.]|nr:hypothetical protein [Tetrasphaera sp.]